MASSNNGNRNKQNRRSNNSVGDGPKVIDNLEETNSFDIIIDEERLRDEESLDISFIEGKRKKKKVAEVIETLDYDEQYDSYKDLDVPRKSKSEVLSVFFIVFFSLILGFLICYILGRKTDILGLTKIKSETITKIETKVVVDDNYVFLGDSIFEGYKLDKYFKNLPVVNSGVPGDTTADVLEDMEDRVYRYNPSKVFLMIGTNDFYSDISSEETVENIGKIVDNIKKNRPYAEIYVQSIYPVNKTKHEKIDLDMVNKRDNEIIKGMNVEIEKLCKEKEITYMNIYDLLVDEEGNLDLLYTSEGLHITSAGYKVITEEVLKVIEEK